MNKEEYVKEKIKFLTELLKLFWITIIAIGGGTISLLLNLDNKIKVFLLFVGAFTEIILISLTLRLLIKIEDYIELLSKLNNKEADK
ncbi:hypothetical protein [Aquifex aeolicus]|uniref:hypothetical protein n=1 Tax=Aquifex aeolicus TaxID=63363 RepID=UPI0013E8E36C|nr:hypothetical protein [Aquifex aeolicus]